MHEIILTLVVLLEIYLCNWVGNVKLYHRRMCVIYYINRSPTPSIIFQNQSRFIIFALRRLLTHSLLPLPVQFCMSWLRLSLADLLISCVQSPFDLAPCSLLDQFALSAVFVFNNRYSPWAQSQTQLLHMPIQSRYMHLLSSQQSNFHQRMVNTY